MNRLAALYLGLLAMIVAHPSSADLVSPYGGEVAPSFAEIVVTEDHVGVFLEIDLSAYPFFVAAEGADGKSLSQRTGGTFEVLADGVALPRRQSHVGVRPRKLRGSAATQPMTPFPRSDEIVYVALEFPFEGQPETITFIPPLGPGSAPVVSLGTTVEHAGVAVTDYRYLSQAETLHLDWQDPWYSRYDNPNMGRHHSSPVMSFLAVEPREVRHEMIVRLHDFEEWVDFGLGETADLSADDVEAVLARAAEFLRSRNPLKIDGTKADPIAVSASRIAIGPEGLRVLEPEIPAERGTMLLGVVLVYAVDRLPSEVIVNWELFPVGAETIPITMTDPAGSVPALFYAEDPEVRWTNHLTQWENTTTQAIRFFKGSTHEIPLLSIALALFTGVLGITAFLSKPRTKRLILAGLFIPCAVGAIAALQFTTQIKLPRSHPFDEPLAEEVTAALLTNLQIVMRERQPSDMEMALRPFVQEARRDQVADEIERGLMVRLPSGARAQTQRLPKISVEQVSERLGRNSHQILANWTADVRGGHWGHMHQQTISYRGLIDVSRTGEDWFLDALTVMSAKVEG